MPNTGILRLARGIDCILYSSLRCFLTPYTVQELLKFEY